MRTLAPAATVGDVMLRHPAVHPADLPVGAARTVFAASPKTHLLLLVADGVLVSTLTRGDLEDAAAASSPARRLGSLAGRVIGADADLAAARAFLVGRGLRRLAVVDPSMRLLGLLCLKRSRTGFCTDEGVARMRHERGGAGSGRLRTYPQIAD